ncbi:hypothetical protein J6590_056421 [Homalodisca vitripennis]|nr:hypothetical protein J6590_056421 [Homalodisca vitripennis]
MSDRRRDAARWTRPGRWQDCCEMGTEQKAWGEARLWNGRVNNHTPLRARRSLSLSLAPPRGSRAGLEGCREGTVTHTRTRAFPRPHRAAPRRALPTETGRCRCTQYIFTLQVVAPYTLHITAAESSSWTLHTG